MSEPSSAGAPPRKPAAAKQRKGGALFAKEHRRLVLGAVLGALVAVFAVLNRDEVEVNWIFGTANTPLIVVIALSFVVGALVGWIVSVARRRGA